MNIKVVFRRASSLVVTAACLFGLMQAAPVAAQRAVPVDRVVAVVGNEVVTYVQLRASIDRVTAQLRRQKIELPPRSVLEEQVLERMILERAQLQAARELGIRVDETTMTRAVARVAENNGMTETELREALTREGMSFQAFREGLRNEILITRLRESAVESKIVVTDAEIDNFITNNPDAFTGNEVLVAHILLRVPENVREDEFAALTAKAEDIVRRHAAGQPFEQLAAEFSDAQDATEGGVIGWRTRDRLPALFADAVRTLKPGSVSPVMRSAAGLHIVKLVDVRGGAAQVTEKVDQTRARHILIRSSEVLPDSEVEARLRALRERIVYGDKFEDLAKVHSEDLSSARGGDLGWVYRGDTVPEFERAMDALEIGEVSQPVRSPFGWHLIEVLERRVQDVTEERTRALARNSLRERKAEEEYENWLRELRDSTYVEIRLGRE
jgi:peptidyl-prolyl cis-trans isomerase SurA